MWTSGSFPLHRTCRRFLKLVLLLLKKWHDRDTGQIDRFIGGGKPLVLREGWDAINQYSGRAWKQTVVTEGGVEDEQLIRMEGWEVAILVIATD